MRIVIQVRLEYHERDVIFKGFEMVDLLENVSADETKRRFDPEAENEHAPADLIYPVGVIDLALRTLRALLDIVNRYALKAVHQDAGFQERCVKQIPYISEAIRVAETVDVINQTVRDAFAERGIG